MWPLRGTLGEILRQLRAERGRAVLMALLVALVTTTVARTELDQVARAETADAALRAAGSNVLRATPASDRSVLSAARCNALGGASGVLAAGGLVKGDRVALGKAPGEKFTMVGLTGSMPRVLTGRPTKLGAGVSAAASDAARLGLRQGDRIALLDHDGALPVGVLDISGRMPDPGAWLFYAAPPKGQVDECWVEMEAGAVHQAAAMVRTWLMEGPGDIVVTPLLSEDKLRDDPATRFRARPNRWAWAGGGVVVGLLFTLVLWFRRVEIALYRSVGAPRVHTAAIQAGHYAPILFVSVLAGTLAGLLMPAAPGRLTRGQLLVSAQQGALVGLGAWIVLCAATSILASGRLSGYIRDRL